LSGRRSGISPGRQTENSLVVPARDSESFNKFGRASEW
jgi:hypothetical protein